MDAVRKNLLPVHLIIALMHNLEDFTSRRDCKTGYKTNGSGMSIYDVCMESANLPLIEEMVRLGHSFDGPAHDENKDLSPPTCDTR